MLFLHCIAILMGARLLHTNDPHGETIEGGDICILSPEVIAIGHSCRTLPQAIERFVQKRIAAFHEKLQDVFVDVSQQRPVAHIA